MTQSPLKCCGLVYGSQEHHLDHIAPLCAYFHIPLIVTDEDVERQAKLYYPEITLLFFSYLKVAEHILNHYSIIITTMPVEMFDSMFFLAKTLTNKAPITIWCPHGNSDKGQDTVFMETLRQEKILLIYGQKMLDFLKEKKAVSNECQMIPVGNYRYAFYKKHSLFYKKIIQKAITTKLLPGNPTYLYAPTWKDHENASSFELATTHLLETLPKDINLIVKFHPNTLLQEDLYLKKLFWKHESNPNVLFLEHFPLIYPLLECVDVYIGDTSSIGYDFLSFNKPMFFLNIENNRPLRYLYQCGTVFKKEDFSSIYKLIKHHLKKDKALFSQKRKEIYDYTFSDNEVSASILDRLYPLYEALQYGF